MTGNKSLTVNQHIDVIMTAILLAVVATGIMTIYSKSYYRKASEETQRQEDRKQELWDKYNLEHPERDTYPIANL